MSAAFCVAVRAMYEKAIRVAVNLCFMDQSVCSQVALKEATGAFGPFYELLWC